MERHVVEYERTIDDHVTANQHMMQVLFRLARPSRWEMVLVVAKPVALIGLAVFALFFRPQAGNQLELAVTILAYLFIIGFLVWGWFVHKPKGNYFPQKSWYEQQYADEENRKALGPCVAAVTANGFVFTTPGVDTRYFWEAIQSVEVDDLAVSAWVGGTPVVTVPRRAFAADDELNQFVQAARDKIAEVRAGVASDHRGLE